MAELAGGFELVDLPAGPFAVTLEQLVEVGSSLLGRGVGTDVTGLQTVTDGQQIHPWTAQRTFQRYRARSGS